MNITSYNWIADYVSAGCHINDVMNSHKGLLCFARVSAGCHINDVMNSKAVSSRPLWVSAGCHINDVMNFPNQLS